jgi:AcrR family transcriptional regulator
MSGSLSASRPRLSRAESQAHTRERLITTAMDLFLADGYAGTSLGKVAEAAGYSKGAVYSNFLNKDELCMAVLDRIRANKDTSLIEAMDSVDDPESLLRAFVSWWRQTVSDKTWMVLETEYLAHARGDAGLRRAVTERGAEVHRTLSKLLTTYLDRCGIDLPIPPETAVTALFGMAIGLGLLHSVDGETDLDALPAVARALVNAGKPDGTRPRTADPGAPVP